jgi:transmembrane sensor
MHRPNLSDIPDEITDAAAHWCMRLHESDCTDAERNEFAQWLAADPLHAIEYEAMLEIWDVADQLPRPPLAQVAHESCAAQSTSAPNPASANVVSMPAPAPRRTWASYGVAAAISLLAIPVAGYIGWNMGWLPSSYESYESTDRMRQLVLADGSQVQMNLGTQLSFSDYKDQRRVTLKKGEAFFEVTHSTEHPFVVKAAQGQVRVTGTRFNVWMYQDQVRVTLMEGSVIVTTGHSSEGYRLDPGMQASYKDGDYEPQIKQTYSNDSTTAWRNGKLVIDNLALVDALPLINRYLNSPVLLADTATGKIRLGGIYNTSSIKDMVASLPKVLPVNLTNSKDGNPVISTRAPKT